ncbi:unnamed protein product [Arctia plantaginis]|uniref:Uncharacterized protein n=1 Tax=Arctia plantaginis TaxID=874455 RepID=A0A8S1BGS7_ARCPL|nr:unnamed protein product [Arctia plantaginis]
MVLLFKVMSFNIAAHTGRYSFPVRPESVHVSKIRRGLCESGNCMREDRRRDGASDASAGNDQEMTPPVDLHNHTLAVLHPYRHAKLIPALYHDISRNLILH